MAYRSDVVAQSKIKEPENEHVPIIKERVLLISNKHKSLSSLERKKTAAARRSIPSVQRPCENNARRDWTLNSCA
ncbi:hypothetical protein C0J52_09961 [Blattella germanica]|nr:hypothetical protein C0J52_09961 [Blattella germanica]